MPNKSLVTGLMSGSSLDGVDLVCCEIFPGNGTWNYSIVAAETPPYPEQLKTKLTEACHWTREKMQSLDLELGRHYANLLNDFHSRYKLKPELISSHGHTILHEPHLGITFQAGNGAVIARETGVTVVNDFRREDVAQGGQGAPMVPIGDRLLFGEYQGCLNLGGFANISYEDGQGLRRAYDIGPANMALNWIAGLEGHEYDNNGELARSGRILEDLLEKMNSLEYYGKPLPKSLGREWFLASFLPLLMQKKPASADLMATTAEHIAIQLARGINAAELKSVLVTGGGALNQNLLERLQPYTRAQIVVPELKVLHFKEALVFALLGLLRIRGEINCLASVTGGQKDLSVGYIHT
ncbi:MAG: anhydro-N-acetylmuramic acid kinase [Bacteroidota bacterium]